MNIEKAKRLKYGSPVNCPADRGNFPISGKVVDRNDLSAAPVHKCAGGSEYIWVLVKTPIGTAVWPSNRLGGY
jgi:hypothetical protein